MTNIGHSCIEMDHTLVFIVYATNKSAQMLNCSIWFSFAWTLIMIEIIKNGRVKRRKIYKTSWSLWILPRFHQWKKVWKENVLKENNYLSLFEFCWCFVLVNGIDHRLLHVSLVIDTICQNVWNTNLYKEKSHAKNRTTSFS